MKDKLTPKEKKCVIDYEILNGVIKHLSEESKELIDFGDSREKAQGYGMNKVLKAILNVINT